MISVILAGGRGIRLWPESRRQFPKQLCKFFDDKTMLDHTIDRLLQAGSRQIVIITSDDLTSYIKKIVADRPDNNIIEILSEPEGKNTAPAVGLVLAKYAEQIPDDVIGIFPADHYVIDNDAFSAAVSQAAEAARKGYLATIGIAPDRPETGFGYIEKTKWEIGELNNVFPVHSFYEKPDLKIAEAYLNSGQHMWNAGIYIGQISTLLEEFAAYLPDVRQQISCGYDAYLQGYSKLPNISLDYGIAEKSQRMAVVPSDFGWSDLGSWNALAKLHKANINENLVIGDVILKDCQQSIVKQTNKTIVLYGVENLLVVETDKTIFISDRNKAQEIKDVVELLTKEQRYDLL
ncbi:MAG: sugar phosphate nucleotidyltransferase [Syntrophomonadaceae bacterium]|nr:sugar phosphate nucleotidyltransferase [Syntrophomonadaceae bacterium]